jgi:hypothetical protein
MTTFILNSPIPSPTHERPNDNFDLPQHQDKRHRPVEDNSLPLSAFGSHSSSPTMFHNTNGGKALGAFWGMRHR